MAGLIVAALTLAWLSGCAEPRGPSGGPRDTTPPALLASEPANEAVNFSGEMIRLEFTEYVNQASFTRAFSITPEPEGQPRFRWRKRRVDIRFQAPLRDSTTYVIALDNNLRDMRSVALKRPITLAFSTGNIIDQGRVSGRAVESLIGVPAAGFDVLAYAVRGDTVADTPYYRTQTGDDGSFALAYLREGPYFVVLVQDRNRDSRPGPNEAFATSPVPVVTAMPDTSGATLHWVISRLDSIPPQIDRIRSTSNSRLLVRFSEAVALPNLEPAAWTLEDSLTGQRVAIRALYMTRGDARNVYLRTDALRERVYRVRPEAAIADSSDNLVSAEAYYLAATARVDTGTVRFTGFLPAESAGAADLAPFLEPRITFSEALLDVQLADLLTATDSAGTVRDVQGATSDGTTYTLQFMPPLTADAPVIVSVRDPGGRDTVYVQQFARLGSRDLGSLSGVALPADSLLVVELLSPTRQVLMSIATDTSGAFAFDELPQGSYHVRAYLDANGNGRWDGGQISPYVAPEPITWLDAAQQVRPRWDTALPDTLRAALW